MSFGGKLKIQSIHGALVFGLRNLLEDLECLCSVVLPTSVALDANGWDIGEIEILRVLPDEDDTVKAVHKSGVHVVAKFPDGDTPSHGMNLVSHGSEILRS
jgi:hypothetical protein